MPRLALYFPNQKGGQPYVLDARYQPSHHHPCTEGWLLGRDPDCDIVFPVSRHPDYKYVSKMHMVIKAVPTAEDCDRRFHWYAKELPGNINSTYLTRRKGLVPPFKLKPNEEYQLDEGDKLQLGASAASITVSYDIDDTEQILHEEVPAATPLRQSPYWVNDVFNPVWFWFIDKNSIEQFFFLIVIGVIVALIVYAWKM